MECLLFQNEVAAALLAATATPTHHHLAEDENEDEEQTNGENGDVSRDLDIDEHIKDPVEDRRTLAERSERLHDQLKVRDHGVVSSKWNLLIDPFFVGPENGLGTVTGRDDGDEQRQDPSGERASGSRQVQDAARDPQGQHEASRGPV